MAIAYPKQISESMYTYPFLCRVSQKGWFNTDLAVISNLRVSRGGNDDTSWTINGLATEYTATFDITPLYCSLMTSSADHPFLFLKNTALMEYLCTMCGVDMKVNNFQAKVDMAMTAISGSFKDMPTNMARGIYDSKLIKGIQNVSTFIN